MQNKANAQPALAAAGSWGLAELGNYIDGFEKANTWQK